MCKTERRKMNKDIKQYADSGDIESLKYIFAGALDVDPTFEHYIESYDYCKSIPGLLESHVELTPFINDPSQWTMEYWVKLKMDLKKNFSEQRMEHMCEVAKVVLEDKVRRLEAERRAAAAPPPAGSNSAPAPKVVTETRTQTTASSRKPALSKAEQQRREIEEAKRLLRLEEEKKEKEREAEKQKERTEAQYNSQVNQKMNGGDLSKKSHGAVIALVAVAVIAAIILLILKFNSPMK